jgi:predicted alpha/beta hydrolase family esterase
LRVVILHGAYGRPDSNWFPWLAERVRAAGHEALLPRFPTPQGQSLEAWLDAYDRQVDDAASRSRTVLVAHSLGVAFALRLAGRTGTADPYRGAFLAAGFWGALDLPDYDPINAPFFAPLDWQAVRAGCGADVACYAADDDPYVPLQFSREIAERLGAPLQIIHGGRHLNAETGMTTFPELAVDLDALLVPLAVAGPGVR